MLSETPYYYTYLTIGYLIIYLGGAGLLIHMWRKEKKQINKEASNEAKKKTHHSRRK